MNIMEKENGQEKERQGKEYSELRKWGDRGR